jgi:membrane-associated protein
MNLEDLAKSFVSQGGLWAYLTLFLSTFIEGFFPLVPSDVVVLFCALMVSRQELHWLPCLASSFSGGAAGALLVYWFGRRHGRGYFLSARRFFITPQRFLAAEAPFKKYGNLIILLNRAIVGGRSFGFLIAGLMRHPLNQVLLYGLSGILAWYLLLLFLGTRFGAVAGRLVNGLILVVMSILILSLISLLLSRLLFKSEKT